MARKLNVEDDDEILEEELDDDELEDDVDEDEVEEFVARSVGIGYFTAGLLIGTLVGAGAVWLSAPARGEVTRRRVKRKLRAFRDDAREHLEDWRDDARRGLSRQRRRLQKRRRGRRA